MGKVQRVLEAGVRGNFGVLVRNRAARSRNVPEVLYKHPMPWSAGSSARRINRLLAGLPHASSYLEVGVWYGRTLQNVKASVRWGVDPEPRCDVHNLPPGVHVHVGTSDEFFDRPPFDGSHFDVIFLDGLHTFRQTYRDMVNAFRLCPDGVVLVDDVVPIDEVAAMPDQEASYEAHGRLGLSRRKGIWQGDVFRIVISLRSYHPELAFCTIEGPDNPQTLVWKRRVNTAVKSASEWNLRSIDAIEYRDVFSEGIPSYFLPMTEDVALRQALSGCLAGRIEAYES